MKSKKQQIKEDISYYNRRLNELQNDPVDNSVMVKEFREALSIKLSELLALEKD